MHAQKHRQKFGNTRGNEELHKMNVNIDKNHLLCDQDITFVNTLLQSTHIKFNIFKTEVKGMLNNNNIYTKFNTFQNSKVC